MPNPPHEKLIEELFVAFAFLYLKSHCRAPRFYAPSQREEKITAIDGSFTDNCLHLYLQFKAAKKPTSAKHNELGMYLAPNEQEQFERLERNYTRGSAFYVLSTFRSAEEIREAQDAEISVEDFLDSYVALPVHPLAHRPKNANQTVRLKWREKWLGLRSMPRLRSQHPAGIPWLHGTTLLDGLLSGRLGSRYEMTDRGLRKITGALSDSRDRQTDGLPSLDEIVGDFGQTEIEMNDANVAIFASETGAGGFYPSVMKLC